VFVVLEGPECSVHCLSFSVHFCGLSNAMECSLQCNAEFTMHCNVHYALATMHSAHQTLHSMMHTWAQ